MELLGCSKCGLCYSTDRSISSRKSRPRGISSPPSATTSQSNLTFKQKKGKSLGLPRCKNLRYFFVSLELTKLSLLFDGLLALLFSLLYVICEFNRFLELNLLYSPRVAVQA